MVYRWKNSSEYGNRWISCHGASLGNDLEDDRWIFWGDHELVTGVQGVSTVLIIPTILSVIINLT
jgi:hypothetical protein